jgi:hypothetical protein
MVEYNEALMNAVIMVAGGGLHSSSRGIRIDETSVTRRVDGCSRRKGAESSFPAWPVGDPSDSG